MLGLVDMQSKDVILYSQFITFELKHESYHITSDASKATLLRLLFFFVVEAL